MVMSMFNLFTTKVDNTVDRKRDRQTHIQPDNTAKIQYGRG